MNKYILLLLLLLPFTASAARITSFGCELEPSGNLTDQMEFRDSGASVFVTGTGSVTGSTTGARSGASACDLYVNGGQVSMRTRIANDGGEMSAPVYFRQYIKIVTTPSEEATFVSVWNRGVDFEGFLTLTTSRTLQWRDDNGAVDTAGATVLNTNQWYRIEFMYDSGNKVEVKIDGTVEIDTGAFAGDGIDMVDYGVCDYIGSYSCGADAIASAGEILFDDMAVNDNTGTAQNSYPGEGSIVYMQPDSAGDNNGCSAGDYSSVDEVTPDGATTICVLDANTGGDILDVNIESVSSAGITEGSTISVLQIGVRKAEAAAGTATLNLRIKSASGGTVASGSSFSDGSTTYYTHASTPASGSAFYHQTSYTDPTTGLAWTTSGTNSLANAQIGANCTDCDPDDNITTLWLLVDYIPASGSADTSTCGAKCGADIRGAIIYN